jgi:hypothetical protein
MVAKVRAENLEPLPASETKLILLLKPNCKAAKKRPKQADSPQPSYVPQPIPKASPITASYSTPPAQYQTFTPQQVPYPAAAPVFVPMRLPSSYTPQPTLTPAEIDENLANMVKPTTLFKYKTQLMSATPKTMTQPQLIDFFRLLFGDGPLDKIAATLGIDSSTHI